MRIIDFFTKAIEDGHECAALAYQNTPNAALNIKASSLSDALSSAFIWQLSPQGGEYWIEVWNKLDIDNVE